MRNFSCPVPVENVNIVCIMYFNNNNNNMSRNIVDICKYYYVIDNEAFWVRLE